MVEINKTLLADSRIRVLSMSIGWGPGAAGCEGIEPAVKNAKEQGIFVISTMLYSTYPGPYLRGLGETR